MELFFLNDVFTFCSLVEKSKNRGLCDGNEVILQLGKCTGLLHSWPASGRLCSLLKYFSQLFLKLMLLVLQCPLPLPLPEGLFRASAPGRVRLALAGAPLNPPLMFVQLAQCPCCTGCQILGASPFRWWSMHTMMSGCDFKKLSSCLQNCFFDLTQG